MRPNWKFWVACPVIAGLNYALSQVIPWPYIAAAWAGVWVGNDPRFWRR